MEAWDCEPQEILDEEPEERSKIFRMRKFEGLSTKEVADKMNINEKKVHYNISIVMEKMKEGLKNYLPMILLLLQLSL